MHAFYTTLSHTLLHPVQCAALQNLQVLSVTGPDAIKFLHGQLTQDIAGLAPNTAAPAGYCTPKGRLLATLVIWRLPAVLERDTPCLQALVRHDTAAFLIKRLTMFALRAKVKLSLAPQYVAGIWTESGTAALENALGSALPHQPWQYVTLPTGTWIATPATHPQQRWWWIASAAQLESAGLALQPVLRQGHPQAWQVADLAAGIPWVGGLSQELFTPQMVNLDLIGGINFTKGCYPGQEVVARTHYRGTLKRRMAYGVIPQEDGTKIMPGMEVFSLDQPGQPCGHVVDSAQDGITAILFEAMLSALREDALRLGSPEGPRIQLGSLPYAYLEAGM